MKYTLYVKTKVGREETIKTVEGLTAKEAVQRLAAIESSVFDESVQELVLRIGA